MDKHLFGPVPSRRLGISLGVDIIPFKTCTLNCIYCECGQTTQLSTERKRYFKPKTLMKEVKEFLATSQHLDFITFSGSGEPTLNKELGKIIRQIKKETSIPIAVLTNSTLLYHQQVRQDLLPVDLILPSLDAADQDTFQIINKPHPQVSMEKIINGLLQFRRQFKNQMWLEVFIVKGVNDHAQALDNLHHIIGKIKPDRVQLNSLDRPPAFDNVSPVSLEELEEIKDAWQDLPVEIIKRIHKRKEIPSFNNNLENSILNTIHRRPLTIEDLMVLTGKNRLELFKYLDVLEEEQKVLTKIIGSKIFYTVP